jgi:Queuine tRNA-ribosyltransferase
MLRLVLESPCGQRKVFGLRFSFQNRHFSGTMSVLGDIQNELFKVDPPNALNTESYARTGTLALRRRRVVETPNFLAITSRGSVPHITPDVLLEHTGIGGVHMALEDCEFDVS